MPNIQNIVFRKYVETPSKTIFQNKHQKPLFKQSLQIIIQQTYINQSKNAISYLYKQIVNQP